MYHCSFIFCIKPVVGFGQTLNDSGVVGVENAAEMVETVLHGTRNVERAMPHHCHCLPAPSKAPRLPCLFLFLLLLA
jgi:hypothetical protein